MDYLSHTLPRQSPATNHQRYLYRSSRTTALRCARRLPGRILGRHFPHCVSSNLRGRLCTLTSGRTSQARRDHAKPRPVETERHVVGRLNPARTRRLSLLASSPDSQIPATRRRQPFPSAKLAAYGKMDRVGHDFSRALGANSTEALAAEVCSIPRITTLRPSTSRIIPKTPPHQPILHNCECPINSTCGKQIRHPRTKPVIVEDTTHGVSLLTGTISGSNFAIP